MGVDTIVMISKVDKDADSPGALDIVEALITTPTAPICYGIAEG